MSTQAGITQQSINRLGRTEDGMGNFSHFQLLEASYRRPRRCDADWITTAWRGSEQYVWQ